MDNFTDLAKYGLTGVCLALIGLVLYIFREFMSVVKNHLKHSTSVQNKLSVAVESLVDVVKALDKRLNGKK